MAIDTIEWPIIGMWAVDGTQEMHPGVLDKNDEGAFLKLFVRLEQCDESIRPSTIEEHPRLAPFRTRNRLNLVGETKSAGRVTLLNCVQTSLSAKHGFRSPTYVELTFLASQAWAGAEFVDITTNYKELSFAAAGLHNVLATSHVKMEWLARSTPESKSDTHDLQVLTGAKQAFLVFCDEEPCAEIETAGKKYKVTFSTLVKQSSSSTMGITFSTEDLIRVEAGVGATIPELIAVADQVEQFLSLLCVGPFRGERIKLSIDPSNEVELIQSLREARKKTFTRMPHEILVSLGQHPGLAVSALKAWFGTSDSRKVARWLIFDSLSEEKSSTAKFLAVTQAWEIIGRENVDAPDYDKEQFRKATEAARCALEGVLGEEAANRLSRLLQSSNSKAFSDLVRGVIKHIPPLAVQVLCLDIDKFVTAVVNARNVLTHMQERKKFPIEKASHLSFYLTYKLIVLFCIYESATLGLPLDNLQTMLNHNKMARVAAYELPDF